MELLVSMIIMGVVTTMLVGIFVAVEDSYGFSTASFDARATASDAMAQMTRELRDMAAQSAGGPLYGKPIIIKARANEIDFTTPYLNPGMTGAPQILLTRYWYSPSTDCIYEQRDTDDNGIFDSGDAQITIASDIVNGLEPSSASPTPLFTYTYYDQNGNLQTASSVSGSVNRAAIQTIQIDILADLNPNHAPTYMNLVSTVQPRNLRQI
jgi:type II secretory pathway component PulJ